jgi:hypothetical protein
MECFSPYQGGGTAMRTREIGVPQFRETFETSSAPVVKGDGSKDHFAVALHQATQGNAVSAASNVAAKDQGPNGSGEPAVVAQPADLAGAANEVSAIGSAKLQQSSCVPAMDQKEGQNIEPRTPANQTSVSARVAIENESAAKPAKVGGEVKATKDEASDAKSAGAKPGGDRAAIAVASWSGADRQPDAATNDAVLQAIVVPQNQALVSSASPAAPNASHSAMGLHKTTPSIGQSPRAIQGEVAADRKTGAKTADGATATTKLDATKNPSSDASSDTAPAGTATESSTRGVLAADSILPGTSTSGGHPVESRGPSIAPTVHGFTSEAASSMAKTDFPVDGTAGGALPHAILNSSATSLEVGVASGTHGWLKIRAEMAGNGEVNASLTGSSPVAANRLRGDLPALNSYLQSEKVQVNELNVHTVLPGAGFSMGTASANTSSDRSSYDGSGGFAGTADGGTAGGRSQQQDGQGTSSALVPVRSEDGSEVLLDRASDPAAFGHGVGLGGKVDLSPVGYAVGGGWLNVRA